MTSTKSRNLSLRNLLHHFTAGLMLIMVTAQPILASPVTKPAAKDLTMAETVATYRTMDGDAADTYTKLALLSDDYELFQIDLADRFGGTFRIQPEKAYVKSAMGNVGVFIPVVGGAGYSSLQVWFDQATRQVVGSVSTLFNSLDDGTYQGIIGVNGDSIMEAVVTEDGEFIDGWLMDNHGNQKSVIGYNLPTKDFNCFLNCLSGLGIPSFVIAVIAVGCAIACGITVGTGCVLCVLAVSVGLGAEVGYCSGQCDN